MWAFLLKNVTIEEGVKIVNNICDHQAWPPNQRVLSWPKIKRYHWVPANLDGFEKNRKFHVVNRTAYLKPIFQVNTRKYLMIPGTLTVSCSNLVSVSKVSSQKVQLTIPISGLIRCFCTSWFFNEASLGK